MFDLQEFKEYLHFPEIKLPPWGSLIWVIKFNSNPWLLQNFFCWQCSTENSCFLISLLPDWYNHHLEATNAKDKETIIITIMSREIKRHYNNYLQIQQNTLLPSFKFKILDIIMYPWNLNFSMFKDMLSSSPLGNDITEIPKFSGK